MRYLDKLVAMAPLVVGLASETFCSARPGVVIISIVLKERRKKSKAVWIDRRMSNKPAIQKEIQKMACFKKSLIFGFILFLLIVLNFLDLLFTSIALAVGAKELNPLMAYFFNRGLTDVVVFLKMGGVGLAAFCLWCFRHLRFTLRLTVFATLIYTFLLIYHLMVVPSILATI